MADLELLGKLVPVHNAGYQAGHHDECLPRTRESVLDGMMGWAGNPQERHVFWLNGLAGTGKSTITQTFSGIVAEAGTLGASFFCSWDYLDRKELRNIFPTLAYQSSAKPIGRCARSVVLWRPIVTGTSPPSTVAQHSLTAAQHLVTAAQYLKISSLLSHSST